jgi:hypothetical protein
LEVGKVTREQQQRKSDPKPASDGTAQLKPAATLAVRDPCRMGDNHRKKKRKRKPRTPWIVQWMAVTYSPLPPQAKFFLWVLTLALAHATRLLPTFPHLPPGLSWL